MRIISIDPGYDRFGVAVISKENGKETLLYSDCVVTNRKDDMGRRLLDISEALERIINRYSPEKLALEKLFFSKNAKTAGGVAEARGVVLAKASEYKIPIIEFSPAEVKAAITGYGKSDKRQIIFMLKKLLPMEKIIKYDDEYDAIAVGLACLFSPLKERS